MNAVQASITGERLQLRHPPELVKHGAEPWRACPVLGQHGRRGESVDLHHDVPRALQLRREHDEREAPPGAVKAAAHGCLVALEHRVAAEAPGGDRRRHGARRVAGGQQRRTWRV
eukprot:4823378-Prymnesium_polylepis.3